MFKLVVVTLVALFVVVLAEPEPEAKAKPIFNGLIYPSEYAGYYPYGAGYSSPYAYHGNYYSGYYGSPYYGNGYYKNAYYGYPGIY